MPPQDLSPGLYDHPLSAAVHQALAGSEHSLHQLQPLDPAEAPQRLARYLRQLSETALASLPEAQRQQQQLALVNQIVNLLQQQAPNAISAGDQLHPSARLLQELRTAPLLPNEAPLARPLIPLADGTLLINAPSEPSVGLALQAECPSADRIDLLCAFIKWSGLRLLQESLAVHLASGRPLRVLTTVYMGATDRRALDWLVARGAQLRVSTDTRRTRLHAKAWLFHRASGTSTAYIGSSNLSSAALVDGLEWNVRLAALETPAMVAKFQSTFDAYWEEGEFEPYAATAEEQARIDHHLARARGEDDASDSAAPVWFNLRPYAYQREMLDALAAERSLHGRWHNLVVAATGTGKTVLTAFDVARLHADFPEQFPSPEPPPLLLIAHRKEILQQALATFRQVLRDPSFGELYVDGELPRQWRHVFASVQSLAQRDLAEIPADRFAVVIVDEFHHAAASSYRRWLDHLRPQLLLGLTATPERADGLDILHWFDGRIAAELRLWSALDQGLLAPFHYFAVADATDLSTLEWRRGGYVPAQLDKLYTGDHRRVDLILQQLHDKLADPVRMRALGFCVSVEHARFMAERFRAAGFAAEALDASTPADLRHEALRRLQAGELQILFAVDLFNEGLDIPAIDTVLLLRPTESAVVFLQQLGRGLRLSPDTGKSCLTVLDFIGQQHRRFRFDLRNRALLGCRSRQLKEQLTQGFPFLPPGCRLVLDRVASERVLSNLRHCLPARRPKLLEELRGLAAEGVLTPTSDLAEWLEALAMDPADFYGIRGVSFTALRRELGWLGDAPHPEEERLSRALGSALLHGDDPDRLRALAAALRAPAPPDLHTLGERERRAWLMLTAQLFGTGRQWRPLDDALDVLWQAGAWRQELRQLLELLAARGDHRLHPLPWALPVPLRVHGHYSRAEIEAAFGVLTDHAPWIHREGVLWHEPSQCDLLFVTLRKSEALFSPTTRYRDLALGPSLFHWESQSTTTAASATGQRYVHHQARGSRVLLFVREQRRQGTVTEPFVCLGFARYESHEGERIWVVQEWRSGGGWSGRSRWRGCQAVAWHSGGVGGLTFDQAGKSTPAWNTHAPCRAAATGPSAP
jgi:superfamily II DNA or RNA helicase